jgi:hypothetical protein
MVTINEGYKTDKVNNMVYEIEKLGIKKYKISSDYSPYQDFSNCTVVEYSLRLTNKKGVIEQYFFSDISGNQNTVRRQNKIFVNKDELNSIMEDIDRDFIAYHDDIIDNDTMDYLTIEQYDIIEQLYNKGA